jgi:hypothetical protein
MRPWPETPVPSTSERVPFSRTSVSKKARALPQGLDPLIFWTLNDSGGEPCVFAIDRSGKTRAKVRVRDAANFDWEDLALGKDDQARPALFIGDIGDNLQHATHHPGVSNSRTRETRPANLSRKPKRCRTSGALIIPMASTTPKAC